MQHYPGKEFTAVILLVILMILALIGADQGVKYWAVHSLREIGSKDFIRIGDTEIIDLTYLENRGAIFGSMAGQKWFLIGFTSVVIIGAVIAFIVTRRRSKLLSFSLALLIAGGIGNLIDRIRLGYVVDMIEIKLFRFAIFNVADICVTAAVFLIIIYLLFIDGKKEGKADKDA
ncbi:MAG TPA: signal peptidase II [Ruminococcus sp.]|nr:signal peptidase II [Ruminococcus sp.]